MKIDLGQFQIRSYERRDKDALIKYANNSNISKNLRDSFPYPYTEKNAVEWLKAALDQNPELNFAIANSRELIGGIGLIMQPDIYRYSAEIGYWLAEPYWGKGIATKAVGAMTKYTFENFKFRRLFAGVFEGNESSMKVLEKSGYKLEGRLREAVYKEERIQDQLMYSILRKEITTQ
jgi:RimJ/RimL family protein N-acetyltransferase